MISQKSFLIRPLEANDAPAIASFLRAQSTEYSRFFYALSPDEERLAEILKNAERDVYGGIFWRGEMLGIFMLRGWDAGFEIPSLGAIIDEKHRGKAILGLTFDIAKLICKLSGVNRYMIKIHPDHTALKNIRRRGFYQIGVEETTGNVIFHLDF